MRADARRLTLVIGSLGGGGAERVLTILANAWVARGDAVALVTLDREAPFYPLDGRVAYRPLGVAGRSAGVAAAILNNALRIRALRAAIRESRPDAVVSFVDTTNVLTLLATRGMGVPVVVSERTDPNHFPIGRAYGALRRWLYPAAQAVIVQTEAAARFFSRKIRERTHVIPNPVLPAPAKPPATPQVKIVALGRLSREKGFDLLIEAFASVACEWPEWSLEIWGEGPERSALEKLVMEAGISGRVRLPGSTQAPLSVLRAASLFVLPSRVEGFPNALLEAMAAGLPVLAADCRSGPGEIVRDGVDGLLVAPGDAAALAEGIRRLLGDSALRARLAARAPEVVGRFALDRVVALWDATLVEASRGGGGRS